jgi:hypothetical protein
MVEASGLLYGLISLTSAAYGAYAGEKQHQTAKKGLRLQEKAQQEAKDSTVRAARIGEEEEAKARQKPPDLNVLLADQLNPKPSQQSINSDRLLLGRPGPLGY